MESTGGWERALRLAAWLVVGAIGLLMLTQAFGWAGTRLVAVVQSLTPYLIAALAPIALVAARRGQARLGFTAGLVGLSGVVLAIPLVFTPSQPPARDLSVGVTVASINLLYTNDVVDRSADAVLAQDADVIVFSEYTAEHQQALTAHPLADDYPFKIDRDGLAGRRDRDLEPVPAGRGRPSADGQLQRRRDRRRTRRAFAIVGVHPPAPVFDFDSWKRDLELLVDRAQAATTPTLVIGDLNASYWHPVFRDLLDTGFVDAHMAHGRGFSTHGRRALALPFVRLDHALTGRRLVSTDVADFDVPGSDHRGFVVTVAPAR